MAPKQDVPANRTMTQEGVGHGNVASPSDARNGPGRIRDDGVGASRRTSGVFREVVIGNGSTMTIFEAIRADHDTQRTLVDLLVATEGDSEGRNELFGRLKRELTSHAAAEERYFYVPLMERDLTQDAARHSVAEHKELDDFVEQLEGYDMSGSQWLQTAKQLSERLVHHLDEEEKEVFPVAGKALSDDEKASLADEYPPPPPSRHGAPQGVLSGPLGAPRIPGAEAAM